MDLETSDQQATILRDVELTRYNIGKVREDMDKLTKKLQGMAEDIVRIFFFLARWALSV